MESLEPVDQHRAVGVVEDVAAHLDDTVRPDADQVPVERRVVELAQEIEAVGRWGGGATGATSGLPRVRQIPGRRVSICLSCVSAAGLPGSGPLP